MINFFKDRGPKLLVQQDGVSLVNEEVGPLVQDVQAEHEGEVFEQWLMMLMAWRVDNHRPFIEFLLKEIFPLLLTANRVQRISILILPRCRVAAVDLVCSRAYRQKHLASQ